MPLLEYATPKLARFEDARVGVLRAALAAVILAYVAVYQFAFHGSWAQGVPVTGTARVTIQQPTVGACDPALAGCLNAFRNKSSLPYCAEFAPAPADVNRTPGSILPCAFFAAPLPVGAELNGATVAVTRIKSGICAHVYAYQHACARAHSFSHSRTRARARARTHTHTYTGAQTNVCDPRADNCAQIFVPSEASDAPGGDEPTYVADMESFTIGMDHTAWAAGDQQGASEPGDVAIASRQKQGKLFVPKNDELCRSMGGQVALERDEPRLSAPCYVKPNTTRSNIDLFRLDVLLLAAARQPTLQSQLDLVNFDGKTFGTPAPTRTP